MAITLLKKPETDDLLKFRTEEIHVSIDSSDEAESYLFAKVTTCDCKLKDISKPEIYQVFTSEKEFHKPLREEAAEHGHLITSHCTDPQWNPEGYSKNLEDI